MSVGEDRRLHSPTLLGNPYPDIFRADLARRFLEDGLENAVRKNLSIIALETVKQGISLLSREPDIEGWIGVAIALAVGGIAGWLIVFHQWNENVTRAAAYTIGIFLLLAMALRPAWHRVRFWIDLLVLFVLHVVLILRLPSFLDSHSIRLTWFLALPFVAVEGLLFLGLLWRRNVSHSPH